jgi:hypothetical protein
MYAKKKNIQHLIIVAIEMAGRGTGSTVDPDSIPDDIHSNWATHF